MIFYKLISYWPIDFGQWCISGAADAETNLLMPLSRIT